ncbi:hypothetical protein KNV19_gp07 [Gordonia phage Portcullis]|uniref:Uncharacterized protein n=4 Tax=Wizardvirus TaxID=2169658 RepID=A0A4Y5TZM7_9CAUD|nr:hypothetical protein KNU56_gp07 [Gordonia phage Arri]YP_010102352.1 hypothetical protein KNU57_gp07 [Gordonia phage Valary]YP_010103017.1 hypothetical protein KNU63_gp07 [Gordonia phage RogerDodger]YP_010109641.1 hypothetical protein KNV19_gp07 [Gordonia phage Portcullis]QDB74784.1 hypothetical protein SEA_ARRI_7 [Gordonia phage Arri]QDB74877.1 hypothetical protein SEA_VALARY_7 [Gordonia phage Valary]QDM56089.1 hypothetical protein SEA_ROGERDODGER_7 [Gordonia phage RogerDodger]QNJ56321.1 
MSAADQARDWLAEVKQQSASSFNPAGSWGLNSALRAGTTHVRALLAALDQSQVVAEWLIAETEYKSDAYSVRQEAKTLRQRDEARHDIKRARAALDELVNHGDLTPSGRRVLRSIIGGES